MNPKPRIMTIRLMNKMAEHPGYAASIGIAGCMIRNRQIKVSGQNEFHETSR